jgi:hypothetical protein
MTDERPTTPCVTHRGVLTIVIRSDGYSVNWVSRHIVSVAVVLVAVTAMGGFFLFARPVYRPKGGGVTIELPAKQPAVDASGAAGWVWAAGTPGWEAGYTIKGYAVSGVQPIEIQAAQLAAARKMLDASDVRVVVASRGGTNGVLAILAAPTLYSIPVKTCLAAVLEGDRPVTWECPGARPLPGDLANAHVFVAAKTYDWGTDRGEPQHPLYLVGVARGDVYRVVLAGAGLQRQTLYTRGRTWGQFQAAVTMPDGIALLEIYGRHGLLQTLPVDVAPGQQRILH